MYIREREYDVFLNTLLILNMELEARSR